jgi:hypothetical protein
MPVQGHCEPDEEGRGNLELSSIVLAQCHCEPSEGWRGNLKLSATEALFPELLFHNFCNILPQNIEFEINDCSFPDLMKVGDFPGERNYRHFK